MFKHLELAKSPITGKIYIANMNRKNPHESSWKKDVTTEVIDMGIEHLVSQCKENKGCYETNVKERETGKFFKITVQELEQDKDSKFYKIEVVKSE